MRAPDAIGPSWPFRVAMIGLVLNGTMWLVPAMLFGAYGLWIGIVICGGATLLNFLLGIFVYKRRLWAVITVLCIWSLPAAGLLAGMIAMTISLLSDNVSIGDFIRGLLMMGGFAGVLGLFIFSLARCIQLIMLARRQSARGFEVIPLALPVDDHQSS